MGSRSIGDKRGWRILRNLLGWLTLSILKGGSLFAFERPEPEVVVLRDSPIFDFPISLFSPIQRSLGSA